MASPPASADDVHVRHLYGGAFICSIPTAFQDVSVIRDVPDNQEVFVHSSSDQSIIIELVEYQNIADDNAAVYHFQDLAQSNDSKPEDTSVYSLLSLPKDQLAIEECSSGWLLHGSQRVAKFNKDEKTCVNILLAVLRLPKYTTDVLVTFNCPQAISAQDDMEMFASVVKSLKLLNPSVFGN